MEYYDENKELSILLYIFLNLMFNILKIYMIFTIICRFYLKKLKLKKLKSLLLIYMIKRIRYSHKKYKVSSSKASINHGLVLKKVHIDIRFNKRASLKSCIHMNTDLRMKIKNDFERKKVFSS